MNAVAHFRHQVCRHACLLALLAEHCVGDERRDQVDEAFTHQMCCRFVKPVAMLYAARSTGAKGKGMCTGKPWRRV